MVCKKYSFIFVYVTVLSELFHTVPASVQALPPNANNISNRYIVTKQTIISGKRY